MIKRTEILEMDKDVLKNYLSGDKLRALDSQFWEVQIPESRIQNLA